MKQSNLIHQIHDYLSDDIKIMNELIANSLSADEELIRLVSNHLASSGGKRMRPILTILSSKMLGYSGEDAIKLAAAVEFIHMATLLHDDVVDDSTMRRFMPSANVIWGNNASILVGDFLFSQAFKLMVSTKLIPALEILSNASSIIIEGEVSQLVQLEQKNMLSEEEYLKIIDAKTAELFAASCSVGAIVSDRLEYKEKLENFGRSLGIIFQMIDDKLDYFGSAEEAGKNIGDDFFEGKVTLPIILLNQELDKDESAKLREIFQQKNRTNQELEWAKNLMNKYKIQSKIEKYLENYKEIAYNHFEKIDIDNKCSNYMRELIAFASSRNY